MRVAHAAVTGHLAAKRALYLQGTRAAPSGVEEMVRRLECVGLSHAIARAALWAGAGALLTSGWLSATWLRGGPLALWLDVFSLAAGASAAATISGAVLTGMAIAASRVATNQAAHPATPLWIPLAIAGGAVTATPLLVLTGTIPRTSALALGAIALAATSLSTGLYLRGLYAARDVRRREAQQAQATPGCSASDALFEPELVAQLSCHAATLEQVRAELEDARAARATQRESLARILTELGTVQDAAKTEREEHLRRIRAHAERILQWREEQATLELNVKSAYSMGRSLRPHSDTRIVEDTHAALTA